MKLILSLCCFSVLVAPSFCCRPFITVNDAVPSGNPLADKLGISAQDMDRYNDDGFNSVRGIPVNDAELLSCDFEGDCCWGNAKPPDDELEFLVAKKAPAADNFGVYFDGNRPPSANYLLVAASDDDPFLEARFSSCPVLCSDEVTVTLKHWTTKNVELRVCMQQAGNNILLNCVPIPRSNMPVSTVILPPGNEFELVIVASNFVAGDGGVAIIDDITVEFESCNGNGGTNDGNSNSGNGNGGGNSDNGNGNGNGNGNSGGDKIESESEENSYETAAPALSAAECELIICADPPCGLTDTSSRSGSPLNGAIDREFDVAQGRFENPITGVKNGKDGRDDKYLAVYLFPGERAGLDAGEASAVAGKILKFDVYEATFDMDIKICQDDIAERSCELLSNPKAGPLDRQWFTQYYRVPDGTGRLLFLVENTGRNQGAVGIDNVELYYPSQDNPFDLEAAYESAC